MYRRRKIGLRSSASHIKIYLAIISIFFLEMVLFNRMIIFGARPDILLLTTLFFSFYFGATRGIETGLICGLLKDLFSITNFGVATFSFAIIGFLAGLLRNKLARDSIVVQFLVSNIAVYVFSVFYFLSGSMYGSQAPETAFWRITFYKGIYTGAAAPFLFFVMASVFKREEIKNI